MRFKIDRLALLLALGVQVAQGATLGNNELFLEVWNGDTGNGGRSYVKDLGITLDALLDAPGCFNYVVQDLKQDAALASLTESGTLPANTTWTVQALNNDGFASLLASSGSQDPINHTGLLATVANPEELLADPASFYPFLTDPLSALEGHLNSAGVTDAKAFAAADPGYYLEDGIWNGQMNSTVVFFGHRQVTDGGTLPMYFLTVDNVDFTTGVIGRDGQPLGEWRFDGQQIGFTPTPGTPAPATCPATTQCTQLPWQTLASGQSITAYKTNQSSDCEAAANKETRVCSNGVLSGSNTFQSCGAPVACTLPWGGTLASGQSITAYKAGTSDNCEATANKETRTCDNGTLSGSYRNQACGAPAACELPWGGTLESGQSITAYQTDTSANCDAVQETRRCDNGKLSGNFAHPACGAPAACDLPWGGQLAHGQSITAYAADISANCDAAKEVRTCDNGTLSGGNGFPSCAPAAACELPWGGRIASGESIAAYSTDTSADCEAAKEIRTCDNGTLSGGHAFQACGAPGACALPWGGQIAHGQSVTAYQTGTSIYCDSLKETRTCNNGVLDGGYAAPSCDVPSSPYVWLVAPNGGESWKTGIRQYIEWTSGGIAANQRLNLYFSKDGGRNWTLVKRGFKNKGHVIWKPGANQATATGSIKLCLAQAKRSPALCDGSDQAFSVTD